MKKKNRSQSLTSGPITGSVLNNTNKLSAGKVFSSLFGKRNVYIWGSGHFGASIYYAMKRIGIDVTGFVDSRMAGQNFLGFTVEKPEVILAQGRSRVFIIISAFLSTDEIAKICEEAGYLHRQDFLTHSEIKAYHFEIDVSGICNLRCKTCPRGNSPKRSDDRMMALATYKKVLDKLISENPLLSDVQLYSWGEPLLNPELPEIISYTSSKGIATAVSSNLSIRSDLEPVIKAGPTWFRVSISGADEKMYSTIHSNGKWNLVLENLKSLSKLRAAFAPDMFVEVNYHLYKHNLDGVTEIARLCRDLGFVFRTNFAFVDPLDLLMEYVRGKPLPEVAEEGRRQLLLDIDEAILISRTSPLPDCVSQNSFVIHSDLSFRRCTHIYNLKENILAQNFLETPMEKILQSAADCELCKSCRQLGLHRFHFAYINRGTDMGSLKI
jgi:MoaA/NifB/PqqE/SkfB family radical SAM enzyme